MAIGLILLSGQLWAQHVYPRSYFQSPMDTPLLLSAPFGSLRDNHFHSGMDVRTGEREGLPIYAVADGYVSRIKYASNGYGKAIYIDHANGYTSVYGHLQKMEGELEAYVKRYQYEKEQADFDHFPGKQKLKVTKGQVIGWSGNTGGSTGPHLHFEIRDTRTEHIINPQLFGIMGKDSLNPMFKRIAVYSLLPNQTTLKQNIALPKNTNLPELTYPETLQVEQGLTGFGAEVVDYLTSVNQEYSIYSLACFWDNKKVYQHQLDRFPFDDSRCINVHIDYAVYKQEKYRIQKCFKEDGNRLGIYTYLKNKGKVVLEDTIVHEVRLEAADIEGRKSVIRFYVQAKPAAKTVTEIPSGWTCYPFISQTKKAQQWQLHVPAKALYDTINLLIKTSPKVKGSYTEVLNVHSPLTPLNAGITISLKAPEVDDSLQSKLLLASVNQQGVFSALGGSIQNDWVVGRITSFTNATVVADTVPPKIQILRNENGIINDTAVFQVKISDQLSGIGSYRATLNGKWLLMEYDAKNDVLNYFFDEQTNFNSKQEFKLVVIDRKGNRAVYSAIIQFNKKS